MRSSDEPSRATRPRASRSEDRPRRRASGRARPSHHHPGQAERAAELADEPGRVEGRAARQVGALDEHDVGPAEPGQPVEDRAAADTAADHDDPRFLSLAERLLNVRPRENSCSAAASTRSTAGCPASPLDDIGDPVRQRDPRLVPEDSPPRRCPRSNGGYHRRVAASDLGSEGAVAVTAAMPPRAARRDDSPLPTFSTLPALRAGPVRDAKRYGDVLDRRSHALEAVLEDVAASPVQEPRGEDREHARCTGSTAPGAGRIR